MRNIVDVEQASVAALELQQSDDRVASTVNGYIVSESESDTAVVSSISSPEVKRLVRKYQFKKKKQSCS